MLGRFIETLGIGLRVGLYGSGFRFFRVEFLKVWGDCRYMGSTRGIWRVRMRDHSLVV